MADATGTAAEAAGGKKPAGKGALIGAILGLTLVAAAGGGGMGLLIGGNAPAPQEPAADEADAAPAAQATASDRLLVPLAPVITNISAPPTTFLRVEASIVVDPELVAEPTLLAAQIGSDTLAFVRSLELAQIEGARGLLHLREDLKERARLRSPAVEDYIIQSLVAQ